MHRSINILATNKNEFFIFLFDIYIANDNNHNLKFNRRYTFESNAIIYVLSKYPKDQVIVPKLSFANLQKRLYRLKWYITALFLNSFFRHLHMISLFTLQKLSLFEGAKKNTCRKKIWFLRDKEAKNTIVLIGDRG